MGGSKGLGVGVRRYAAVAPSPDRELPPAHLPSSSNSLRTPGSLLFVDLRRGTADDPTPGARSARPPPPGTPQTVAPPRGGRLSSLLSRIITKEFQISTPFTLIPLSCSDCSVYDSAFAHRRSLPLLHPRDVPDLHLYTRARTAEIRSRVLLSTSSRCYQRQRCVTVCARACSSPLPTAAPSLTSFPALGRPDHRHILDAWWRLSPGFTGPYRGSSLFFRLLPRKQSTIVRDGASLAQLRLCRCRTAVSPTCLLPAQRRRFVCVGIGSSFG
ncbi:hypothetical protein NDU88_005022 [Pleurodeles waltl]|uniref:Uncharacterized protein n=1 Tax=Pleurodeles waltl TaxID=8319 RepID=A0AAV7QH27_PLEWA|nr:hypothetical protein NDU88_005022 [Pleurodeles waltl]